MVANESTLTPPKHRCSPSQNPTTPRVQPDPVTRSDQEQQPLDHAAQQFSLDPRSSDPTYGSERSQRWEFHHRLLVPTHAAWCKTCTDYLDHLQAASDTQDESLSAAFQAAAERYASKVGIAVTRLEARLDECHANRVTDAEQYEKALHASIQDRARYETVRAESIALRERIGALELELATILQSRTSGSFPSSTSTLLDASSQRRAPALPASMPHAQSSPTAASAQPNTDLFTPPGLSTYLTATTPAAKPSQSAQPRPAPKGDKLLAQQMYERQFIEFDEEWLSIAALEKEANREAAEERSGGKLRKRGEDRARSYAAAANRDTTTETGRPALTAGEKRKTAPTSPDGARPAPAAPIQGAASNQQLVSTQPPQYIQQPPSEQGEWVLVRGLHWLRNRGSEGLRLWDRLGDEEIASIFSTGRNRELGDITRLQLLLLQAQPPRDRSRWSPLQTAVSSFVAEQTHNTTHPVAQLSRRSPGVLLGANGVYNHVDYTVQLFFDALVRMHDTLRGTYPEHYASLFQRIHAVLGRPGRYREMVRRLDRAAEDPEPTATLLESSNIFHATSFTHPADITELDAVRYMWEVLRIPHTVVSRALEPYAQRFERHNIAMDIMHRLFIQDRALPEQQQSLQWISRNHASRAFRAQSVLSFGIRSVVLFASGPIVGWAEPTESMEPTTGEVDVSMAWLPNSIRTRFEEEYWSRIQQRERQ